MAYFTITRKSKKRCSRVESPHHDVVECILERVPVKSLLRFKSVSKQWKSTIESRFFQTRQLVHRQQSGDPDVLMVSVSPYNVKANIVRPDVESLRTLVLGSSSSVKIPTPWENKHLKASYSTCDGLVCLYTHFESGFVVNPTTRWHRPLPLSNLQQLVTDSHYPYPLYSLGFGKDKFTGTYKPVNLVIYLTSAEIGLENATTCEVFDFHTNAWRYVTPAAPYRILPQLNPVFVDGLLHWFTDCKETKLVSFDLHTEAFEVVSKAPFANVDLPEIVMCNLDNRLCVSHMTWPNQVIWSFHSSNKTWDKMYSLDLHLTNYWHDMPTLPMPCALVPLALLDGEKKTKKKKKLMLYDRVQSQTLLTHDPETKSYEAAFSADSIGRPVCYFPSLFSI